MLGLALYLPKNPMAWLMLCLVQTDRYSNLPTSLLYGNASLSSKLLSMASFSFIDAR